MTRTRGVALAASIAVHVLITALVTWMALSPRSGASSTSRRRAITPRLVWIPASGPGGGGGGGGDRTPIAAQARRVGRDRLTVPSAAAASSDIEPSLPPPQIVSVPLLPMAAATEMMPGLIEAGHAEATTQGPGRDGGAGAGTGPGIGDSDGLGVGPGLDRGMGGDRFGPGGVTLPQVVREVKPNYTAEAMRAKMQGLVSLSCVVLPDGTVGEIRVVRSLDRRFGLDEEAMKAAQQWRFVPGRRFGQPVAVLVTIELAFNLR